MKPDRLVKYPPLGVVQYRLPSHLKNQFFHYFFYTLIVCKATSPRSHQTKADARSPNVYSKSQLLIVQDLVGVTIFSALYIFASDLFGNELANGSQ